MFKLPKHLPGAMVHFKFESTVEETVAEYSKDGLNVLVDLGGALGLWLGLGVLQLSKILSHLFNKHN